jgi:hypothetical protein
MPFRSESLELRRCIHCCRISGAMLETLASTEAFGHQARADHFHARCAVTRFRFLLTAGRRSIRSVQAR